MAGVTVMATTIDASTASPYEMARGRKNAPDRPFMNSTGSSVITSMSVA